MLTLFKNNSVFFSKKVFIYRFWEMVQKFEFLVQMYVQLIQYACSSTCIYDTNYFWNIKLLEKS
jgi:hypothetical protein